MADETGKVGQFQKRLDANVGALGCEKMALEENEAVLGAKS